MRRLTDAAADPAVAGPLSLSVRREQLINKHKEIGDEHENILDFWCTSEFIIRNNNIPVVQIVKSNQRRMRYWSGYSNLIEYCFPVISLAC